MIHTLKIYLWLASAPAGDGFVEGRGATRLLNYAHTSYIHHFMNPKICKLCGGLYKYSVL